MKILVYCTKILNGNSNMWIQFPKCKLWWKNVPYNFMWLRPQQVVWLNNWWLVVWWFYYDATPRNKMDIFMFEFTRQLSLYRAKMYISILYQFPKFPTIPSLFFYFFLTHGIETFLNFKRVLWYSNFLH